MNGIWRDRQQLELSVVTLAAQGLSLRTIGQWCGLSSTSVRRILWAWESRKASPGAQPRPQWPRAQQQREANR